MKKLISRRSFIKAAGAGAAALGLAACGGSGSTSTAASSTAASSTAASGSAAAASDTVKSALEGVKLTFGTTGLFAPFSYYDTDGKTLIGFDLDFYAALKDYLGFEQDGDIQVMDYSALTTSLAEGKLDIGMAALCATDERKKVINFTETYCDSGLVIAINTETSPAELTDVSMLTSGDYTVAVEKGTASHIYLTNIGVPTDCMEVHDEITTAYESAEQGKVDCVIQDGPGLAYYVKTKTDTKLEIIGEEFNQGQSPYAVAISFDCAEENDGIVDIFTQAIAELVDDGTFAELSAKWLE